MAVGTVGEGLGVMGKARTQTGQRKQSPHTDRSEKAKPAHRQVRESKARTQTGKRKQSPHTDRSEKAKQPQHKQYYIMNGLI